MLRNKAIQHLFSLAFAFIIFLPSAFSHINISNELDSLQILNQEAPNDSIRRLVFIKISLALLTNEKESYLGMNHDDYIRQAYYNAKTHGELTSFTYLLDDLGVQYRNSGTYEESLFLHRKSLSYADSTNNLSLKAKAFNNIGVVYRRIDDYQKAMENHLQALKIAEKQGDSISMAVSINSMGNIHMLMGSLDDAMKYFRQSLQLEQSKNNALGIAINLNNIGNIYSEKGDFAKALEYYSLSLNVNREIGSKKGIAICLNDIGRIYQRKNEYRKAHTYFQRALNINRGLGDMNFLSYSYLRLGEIHILMNQYDSALRYIKPGLQMSLEIGSKANIMEGYTSLYTINRQLGNYEAAFSNLSLAHSYQDSILNNRIQTDIAKLRIRYESEQKENQILLLQQSAEVTDLRIKRQQFLGWFTLSAFIIALGALTFVSFYLYTKNKSNKLLLEKNKLIENAQNELKEYAGKLLIAKQEAELNNKTKSEFLANISHEIRTPLNSVIGFADLISESTESKVDLGYLESIKSSGNSLLTLINDILDLSKIEAGRFNIFYQPVYLDKILEDIEGIFSIIIKEKKLQFKLIIENDLPTAILFSEIRLRQILFNLVGNAIKFTENGFVELGLNFTSRSPEKIDFKLWVKDSGSGISLADQETIFEPFSQADGNSEQGTGLGLTITKRLVEVMNGQIILESEKGKGSKFTVYFTDIELVGKPTIPKELLAHSIKAYESFQTLVFVNSEGDSHMCIAALEKLQFRTKVVIADLHEAKNNITKSQFVLICIPVFEEALNALSVMRQVANQESIQFVVYTNITGQQTPPYQNVAWEPVVKSEAEYTSGIISHSREVYLKMLYQGLLTSIESIHSDPTLKSLFKGIYDTLFAKAFETKMQNNIKVFAKELSSLAKTHNLPNIVDYSDELTIRTELFETESMDILLQQFERAFTSILNKVD